MDNKSVSTGLLPGRSYLLLAYVTRVTHVTCWDDRVLGHVAGRAETIIMAALGGPWSRGDAPACSDTRACHGAFGPARIGVDRGFGVDFVHYRPHNSPTSPNQPT